MAAETISASVFSISGQADSRLGDCELQGGRTLVCSEMGPKGGRVCPSVPVRRLRVKRPSPTRRPHLLEKWVRISFALIETTVRIETGVSATKQTKGVVSTRDILTNLPEHDLGKFGAILGAICGADRRRALRQISSSGTVCVEAFGRRHDDRIVSTARRGAQRYRLRNYGWARKRRNFKFQVILLTSQSEARKNRIEVSYEILWAAPKRPISARSCDLWTRKSGCAALRMTIVTWYEWMSTKPFEISETEKRDRFDGGSPRLSTNDVDVGSRRRARQAAPLRVPIPEACLIYGIAGATGVAGRDLDCGVLLIPFCWDVI